MAEKTSCLVDCVLISMRQYKKFIDGKNELSQLKNKSIDLLDTLQIHCGDQINENKRKPNWDGEHATSEVIECNELERPVTPMSITEIMKVVDVYKKHKRLLWQFLNELKTHNDTITWNKQGEIIIHAVKKSNSSIVELCKRLFQGQRKAAFEDLFRQTLRKLGLAIYSRNSRDKKTEMYKLNKKFLKRFPNGHWYKIK